MAPNFNSSISFNNQKQELRKGHCPIHGNFKTNVSYGWGGNSWQEKELAKVKTTNSPGVGSNCSSMWGQSSTNQHFLNNKQKNPFNSTASNSWLVGKSSSSHLPPKFGGMNMGDVLNVTLAQEMSKVGMGSYKPIDLTQRGLNLSTKKDRSY